MSHRFSTVPIGETVSKVSTCDPRTELAGGLFEYIDIGLVNRETKRIEGRNRVAAEVAPSRARQIVKARDILVSTVRPNLNAVAQVPDDLDGAIASTGFTILRPKESVIDDRYLFQWVKSPQFIARMVDNATGASYPAVSDRLVKDSMIPLPTLDEQRHIAAVLDKADALRERRQQAIHRLDSLLQSFFLEMFGDPVINPKGWPVEQFPNVVFFQEGPGIRNWQFRDQGIKLINVRNLINGELVVGNTERHLDPREVETRYKHFLLEAGDFVMASSGVTWGKIGEVLKEDLPLCLNTSMIRIRPRDEKVIDKTYLRKFIESTGFRNQIGRLITGSAQPNFGPAHLKQVVLPLPPLKLQGAFRLKAQAISKLGSRFKDSVTKLDQLFLSIRQRAFEGELLSRRNAAVLPVDI